MNKKAGIISVVLMIIIVLMLISGFFLYLDANDLREQFPISQKMFLYKTDNTIKTGMQGVFNDSIPIYLDKEKIEEVNNLYKKKDYQKLLESNYKIFIMNRNSFDAVSGQIDFLDKKIQKEFLLNAIDSDDAILAFVKEFDITNDPQTINYTRSRLYEKFGSDEEFKGAIFSLLIDKALDQNGQSYMILEYKKNNIIIYPDSITLRIIKTLPDNIIRILVG